MTARAVWYDRSTMSRTLAAGLILLAALLAACNGDGDGAPPTPTPEPTIDAAQAGRLLDSMVLRQDDIGAEYERALDRTTTNEQAALLRPDTANARQQFQAWGRVLGRDVQYNAPASAELLFQNKTARLNNSATLYTTADGASASLVFVRALPEEAVAAFIQQPGEGGGTLSETRVEKDIAFSAVGDESFAWRITGKFTFPDGFTVNYVADALFLRVDRVAGSVITIALGQPPDRAQLEALAGTFVENVRAAR